MSGDRWARHNGTDGREVLQRVACSWHDGPPCTRFEASSCYSAVSRLIAAGLLPAPDAAEAER